MLSALQTKLLFAIAALLASIGSYCAYQMHQQALEQIKVNNLMQRPTASEKRALDATSAWGHQVNQQKLK